jgi:hypothetical protein
MVPEPVSGVPWLLWSEVCTPLILNDTSLGAALCDFKSSTKTDCGRCNARPSVQELAGEVEAHDALR